MQKVVIIKYGELTTKKDNINFFIKTLLNNIESNLNNINHSITYDRGRMYIKTDEYDKVIEVLTHTFGIHEINEAYELSDNNIDSIKNTIISLIKDKDFNTFKVKTKRSNKNYPIHSMEVNNIIGDVILKENPNKKVDVNSPDLLINIEIRLDKSYIYFDKIKGIGGYPVGTLGKGLLMLSGGIDSPVAGYLALKRGVRIEAIYFESPPHTSMEAKNKVLELVRILSGYSGYIKIHIINFTNIQESIYKNCSHEYLVTIMRRMMYRISERIAYKSNAKVIINGESIGQVASQTLTSINVINETIKMPVIRPVCCLDKLEIIEIAKKINTYETSILPYEDCCTIFVPDHPIINPNLNTVKESEQLFDYEELINEAIKSEEIIKITPKVNKYEDFL